MNALKIGAIKKGHISSIRSFDTGQNSNIYDMVLLFGITRHLVNSVISHMISSKRA
jgi:hypothetical protein